MLLGTLRCSAVAAPRKCLQLLQSRALAASAPGEDPFMDIFKRHQETYRKFLEKTQDIPIPAKTDKKGIQDFATKLTAIRKELGLYWTPAEYRETVYARMAKLKGQTDGSMRDFLSKANSIGVDPAVQRSLLAALDGIETKLGRPMAASGDEEAQPLFDEALTRVKKEFKADPVPDEEMLAKADYDLAETIARDLQEMSPQEFFNKYAQTA
uniref:Uncharacterized protein n=1 Tax=Tetraselmis sp. GSL018 TaxID=582737 RepID=A0A061S5Q9_9CHLO|eukprot:CAMPEP_0177603158 /NCGR_PEP_ID=MMETSP0419_2-20121207/15336_1 /TAXON_ID=582737 /ORGANISM="Tetraselmis sp., Strain GSL018" /LENGTH=210 /DNA_ID=CAMNT_0019096857 /DNA_START=87 /DNA_END=719 /DNA_ORIENTATION=-